MPLLENLKKQFDQLVKTPEDSFDEDLLPHTNHFQISNSIYLKKGESEPILKKNPTLSNSFAEVHKTAYSHGLEKTYAIETINLDSIRKLQLPDAGPVLKVEEENSLFYVPKKGQMEFDFGIGFRNWISPIFLDESIRFLGLSPFAEQCLEKNGKWKIQDILHFQNLVFLKGIGQGHVDEIQTALKNYLANRCFEREYVIQWDSWIKSLVGTFDRKKSYLFLEKYDLHLLIKLTPAENVEIKRLSNEKKEMWLAEALAYFTSDEITNRVHQKMREIVEAFLKPWMIARGGLATSYELMERLKKISSSQKGFKTGFQFLNQLYFSQRPCFEKDLILLEKDLFCTSSDLLNTFEELISKSKTYFCRPATRYLFSHFVQLLEREYAQDWREIQGILMEKMLRLSSTFSVRKGLSKQLEIKLS